MSERDEQGLFDKVADVFEVENLALRENPVQKRIKDLCPNSKYRSSFVDANTGQVLRTIGCDLTRDEIIKSAELYPESRIHPIYVEKIKGGYSRR